MIATQSLRQNFSRSRCSLRIPRRCTCKYLSPRCTTVPVRLLLRLRLEARPPWYRHVIWAALWSVLPRSGQLLTVLPHLTESKWKKTLFLCKWWIPRIFRQSGCWCRLLEFPFSLWRRWSPRLKLWCGVPQSWAPNLCDQCKIGGPNRLTWARSWGIIPRFDAPGSSLVRIGRV